MMASSAISSPIRRNVWIVYIASILAWGIFLSLREEIVGSQWVSFFSTYPYILTSVLAAYCVFSSSFLASSVAPLFPESRRTEYHRWSMIILIVICQAGRAYGSDLISLLATTACAALGMLANAMGAKALMDTKTAAIEVRREIKRINWPSHAETLKFVGVVAIFVTISALFWWIIDGIITRVLSFMLHLLS